MREADYVQPCRSYDFQLASLFRIAENLNQSNRVQIEDAGDAVLSRPKLVQADFAFSAAAVRPRQNTTSSDFTSQFYYKESHSSTP